MHSDKTHEKRAIRHAFANAANDYDSVAQVQRRTADLLLMHLPEKAELSTQNIALDAGCGTAYVTRKINQHYSKCIALDIAQKMAMRAIKPTHDKAICGDIESLPFATNSFDLYISSLAWQWTHTQTAIQEAARVLKPGGRLLVATLGEQTMHELRTAFAQIDNAEHVRQFEAFDQYSNCLEQAGFSAFSLIRQALHTFSIDLHSLLRDIRTLGAHVIGQPRRQGLLGRDAWLRLQQYYEAWRTDEGLPVTYDVIFIKATKSQIPPVSG